MFVDLLRSVNEQKTFIVLIEINKEALWYMPQLQGIYI